MALAIKKAVKFGAKLRMALYGPSGSGKTYTALSIARELAGDKRVIVIDTERGSASKYADIFDFDVIELENFHPHSYIEAIKMVVQAKAYSVLIIDSTTHEWDGSKGALELAGQNFVNWAKVTPLHNAFTDAMLSADIHVIATMRAKEEYVMGEAKNGKKSEVRSVGIEPIQRKGMQYEFDVVGSLDIDNTLTIVKTRCSALLGGIFHQAGKQVADILNSWLDGAPAPTPTPAAPTAPTNAQQEHKPVPTGAGQVQGSQGATTGQNNGSTPAPAPREAKAAEPVPPPKATDQQVASIRKLCTHTGMSEPENLAGMPYFEAKALLEELTAEYKKQRLGQIKKRIEAVGVKWEDAKTDKKLRGVKDEDLTINQLNLLNTVAAEYEQNQATSKAS